MNVTILNGEPDAASAFDAYLGEYAEQLAANGHKVQRLDLRDLDLKGCSGCWGCWVKTPGECVKRDDSAQVCRAVLGSDLTVLASPMRMGFTSSLLKRAADQMIPLVHPYLVIEGGEMHHRPRYERYPLMGLLLAPGRRRRRRGPRDHRAPLVAHGAQHEVLAGVHHDRDRHARKGGRR